MRSCITVHNKILAFAAALLLAGCSNDGIAPVADNLRELAATLTRL